MPDIYTTRQVAELLGVREWEIENALRRREVPRPPVVGRMRIWSRVHVDRLRESLASHRRRHATRSEAHG